MGQQQLLLLVLGIVIVGLAVVVGIQAFGENQKKANADAMVNDGVRIASDLQAWALKPAAFGGGGNNDGTTPFVGADFDGIGYTHNTGTYTNLNADYTLTLEASGASVLIAGVSDTPANTVEVRVCGTTPDDIRTAVNTTAAAC
jgi:hypothetical protein